MLSECELADFLDDPEYDVASLHQAALRGNQLELEEIIKDVQSFKYFTDDTKEKYINSRMPPFGATALILAATEGFAPCVSVLLYYGALIDFPDIRAQTPLFASVKNNKPECAKILLEHGADPNGSLRNNTSPLYIACHQGYSDCVQILIDHGADMESPHRLCDNAPGWPLRIAIVYQHLSCVMVLLRNGAEVNLTKLRLPHLAPQTLAQLSLPHAVVHYRCPLIFAKLLREFGASLWQKDVKNRYAVDLDEDCEAKRYFVEVMGQPLSLLSSCRLNVRRQLGKKRLQFIPQLGLPSTLNDYLQYK